MRTLSKIIVALILYGVTGFPPFAKHVNSQDTTFNYTGDTQVYVVPSCVDSIIVDARGAKGSDVVVASGNGGRVQATIPVTPGESLRILVGEQPTGFQPGWNGGGSGSSGAGGGGGASDIRQGGTAFSNRVIVAGGGGGCGYQTATYYGGNGGGLIGMDGGGINDYGGKGGSQTSGGAGGTASNSGSAGSIGQGGDGGGAYAGGGGGGYYGGGGAATGVSAGGGGGGGSSYTTVAATNVNHTQGYQIGHGQVSFTLMYSPPPASPAAINGDTIVCDGATVSYTVNAVAEATAYNWSFPAGATIDYGQGTDSVVVTFGTTSGEVSVTAENSCGASAPVTLPVNVASGLTADAGPDTTVCEGDAVQLTASGGGDYGWSPAAGLSCTNCQAPVASPDSTTQYIVTVSSGSCTPDTDTIEVTLASPPLADAGNDQTICLGDSVQLNASGPPESTYNWSPASDLSDSTVAAPWANPSDNTIYTVIVTDSNDCTRADSLTVFVNPPLVADAGSDTAICAGDAVQLTASGGTNYAWSPADGLSCTDCADPVAAPAVTTTYTVTVSSGSCTPDTNSIVIIVNSPLADAGSDAVMCKDESVQLAASGGTSYAWSPADGLSCTDCPDPVATPAATTEYSVTVTDANGCQADASVVVTVETCSGLAQIAADFGVQIYPNPAREVLNITLTQVKVRNLRIELINMQGQVIYIKEEKIRPNYSHQLDVHTLPSGVYYLKLSNEAVSSTIQVIIP